MAEAHQAISYSKQIKHDQEVLQLVWVSGLRSWKKRFAKFKSKVKNGVYPAHLESLWLIMGTVMAVHFATQKVPLDLVNILLKILPE